VFKTLVKHTQHKQRHSFPLHFLKCRVRYNQERLNTRITQNMSIMLLAIRLYGIGKIMRILLIKLFFFTRNMSFHVETIYNRISFRFSSASLTHLLLRTCNVAHANCTLNESTISLTYRLIPITAFKLLHNMLYDT